MDRAPFGTSVTFHSVGIAGINLAHLVIPANTHPAPRGFHALENMLVEPSQVRYIRQNTQLAAAHAQIKDNRIDNAQIGLNDAAECISIVCQPLHKRAGAWAGREATGMAKCIVSQPRVNIYELFEQGPRWLFTDGQIGIVWLDLLLVGRVDYADA